MIFNSKEFIVFLAVFYLLYIFIRKNVKLRNTWILFSSLFFYGWSEPNFVILLLFSTILDYFIGLKIYSTVNVVRRKLLLSFSLLSNFGLLFYYKYFAWIAEDVFNVYFDILLPVGISFYTFQTVSYSIDIFKGKQRPEEDFLAFASYVTFFPQLVAGPIERAENMLPQFKVLKSTVDYDRAFRFILLGFFQKIIIGDGLGVIVDNAWSMNIGSFNKWIGSVAFSLQIYGDFAGYSNIALGVAELLGFQLTRNFNRPYSAVSIRDFWSRWHISLTKWFTDYLYIPLGGNRSKHLRNILIVFVVSGLWHGANWTFLVWGLLHGIALVLNKWIRVPENYPKLIKRLMLLFYVNLTWVFFRADSINSACNYLIEMFSFQGWEVNLNFENKIIMLLTFLYLLFGRKIFFREMHWIIEVFLAFVISMIVILFSQENASFIYFKF